MRCWWRWRSSPSPGSYVDSSSKAARSPDASTSTAGKLFRQGVGRAGCRGLANRVQRPLPSGGFPWRQGGAERCGRWCLASVAHLGSRAEKPALAAGKYAVESIRSRASLDGHDQLIEIGESGTKLTDGNGAEHVLTERGALLLDVNGVCRLALAVSVDGEDPGALDRACTWAVAGDQFFLGDATAPGSRTAYQVNKAA